MGLHIGIDFGTSTNYVVRWNEDTHAVEPVGLGGYGRSQIFPNVIYYENSDNFLVGDAAVRKSKLDIKNGVWEIKRHLEEDGFSKYIPNISKTLSSIEIARDIFRWIKQKVEEKYGGTAIDDVVISVPFAFQNKERQKIKNAAVQAGLHVRGLIEEPVAAALSFGLLDDVSSGKKEKIMVFDLGGGTFDVTIFDFLKKSAGNFSIHVLATGGEKELGGVDIDNLVTDKICQRMEVDFGDDGYRMMAFPPEQQEREMANMRNYAVELKQNLSSSEDEDLFLDSKINDDWVIDTTVPRVSFEQWLTEFLSHIKDAVETTLDDAQLDPEDIDRIILVGGTSNIPIISQLLTDIFHKEPEKVKDPSVLVGEGAAIYCGMRYVEKTLDFDIVIGLSHAVGAKLGHGFEVLISRNSPYGTKSDIKVLPVRRKERDLELNIFQGTRIKNQKIGYALMPKEILKVLSNDKIGICLGTDENDGTIFYELYDIDRNGNPTKIIAKEDLKGE